MSQKNWREILKEMEAANPQNDSLELGDSWKAMPRRTEGLANKTNGLYRRSALPTATTKNLYNIIIEKPPKTTVDRPTNSNLTNEAAATQSQKTLIPSVVPILSAVNIADDVDSFDFSHFLNGKNNDPKAVTSTPFPLRQINANRSPKSTNKGDVQRRAADSPKKSKLTVPVPIAISTPRTSRIPVDPEQNVPQRQCSLSNQNKMSSAIVSSTVDTSSDDGEVLSEAAKSPEEPALLVHKDRTPHTTENADQNCLPFDEDQQEQDACTKPSDEALFRRPQMVRRPSQRQSRLDPENETTNQSELSNHSQRNKKSKQKVDILLENYKKVGESIINKTNSVQSANSTSSSRRKLYKKGDSCNEDQIGSQQSCDYIPVPANTNGTFSKTKPESMQPNVGESDTTGCDRNDDVPIRAPKRTTSDLQPEAILQKKMPVATSESEQMNLVDLTDCSDHSDDSDELETQDQRESSHKSKGHLVNDVQHATSSKQDTEKDCSKANGIGQLNQNMSEKHTSERVLAEILEDWPDTCEKQNNNEDFRSDLSDAEQQIQKQPPKESRVRQVRSKNVKNKVIEKPSSKPKRGRQARANVQRVDEEVASDEDELLTDSLSHRISTKNNSLIATVATDQAQKKEVSKKSRANSVKSRQQQESIEDDPPDSNQMAPIEEEPPTVNTKKLRSKNQRANIEVNELEPSKKSRSKKRHIESVTGDDNEVELVPVKAKKKRLNVEDDVTATNSANEPANSEDVEANELQPSKKSRQKKRHIASKIDGDIEVGLPQSKAPVKAKKKRLTVEEDATEANGAADEQAINDNPVQSRTDDEVGLPPTKAPVKAKKKRSAVAEDVTETDGADEPVHDNPVQSQADDNANKMQSSKKSKSRNPSKRQRKESGSGDRSHIDNSNEPNENDENQTTSSNVSGVKKRQNRNHTSKWESYDSQKIARYDFAKLREPASGLRHSTRERRVPKKKVELIFSVPRRTTTNRSNALRESTKSARINSSNRNVSPPKKRRIHQAESENVYSMLLNGTNNKEPPLISRFHGIEITQGFHTTVKNNLVIHHIPGETGPSYGYFKLEPGMVKRSCRISWNLHIHVVSGPVQIIIENETETMETGSLASLPSGTKYSLRNDGENPALVFFNQHLTET